MVVPSIMHMRLTHETSLFYGKTLGRPPDPELVRDISHYVTPFIDPGGVGILEGYYIVERFLGRLEEEGDILPLSSLPTLTPHIALREYASWLEDGTIMVQGDYSLNLEA